MDATPTTWPSIDDPLTGEARVRRLAEMVQHLTDCSPTGALHAVKRSLRQFPASSDEALDVVARAIVCLKRGIDLRDQIELD